MDQLKTKVVDVVLLIQQIKDFDLANGIKLEISVNFNESTLEADPILIENYQQQINTNLIWTINKRDLRKIRTLSQPLRLNCFVINQYEIKEKFGHVLIDLRCAQIITNTNNNNNNESQILYKWYKLIGLRNRKRNNMPEINVALIVREHDDNLDDNTKDIDFIEITPKLSTIPVKYGDGFIQIGDNSDDCYLLEILIKSTKNLELLLPEILIFNRNDNKYYLIINIFGITVRTKDFDKNLNNINSTNEKTLINLKSIDDHLRNFIKDQFLEIGFYSGDDLLGNTRIELENLTNFNQRLILNDCLLKLPSENGRIPFVNNRQPTISLELVLVKLANQQAGDCRVDQLESDQVSLQNDLDCKRDELQRLSTEINEKNEEFARLNRDIQQKNQELARLNREILQKNQQKFEIYDKSMLVENINCLEERVISLEAIIKEKDEEIVKIRNVNVLKQESLNLLDQLENLEKTYDDLQLQCEQIREYDGNEEEVL